MNFIFFSSSSGRFWWKHAKQISLPFPPKQSNWYHCFNDQQLVFMNSKHCTSYPFNVRVCSLLTVPALSKLCVLPWRSTLLSSTCEGNVNGRECRLVSSLAPVHGSLGFKLGVGALGTERICQGSGRLEGMGSGFSAGVEGRGLLWGLLSPTIECGLSGGGGGGRSRSVGGTGNGLSLWCKLVEA